MKSTGKVLLALGCGAAIGALLGVLFAPDKGSETRKKLSDTANDLTKKMKNMRDSVTGKMKMPHNGRTGVENEVNEYVS
jgi:gas vesicle protein